MRRNAVFFKDLSIRAKLFGLIGFVILMFVLNFAFYHQASSSLKEELHALHTDFKVVFIFGDLRDLIYQTERLVEKIIEGKISPVEGRARLEEKLQEISNKWTTFLERSELDDKKIALFADIKDYMKRFFSSGKEALSFLEKDDLSGFSRYAEAKFLPAIRSFNRYSAEFADLLNKEVDEGNKLALVSLKKSMTRLIVLFVFSMLILVSLGLVFTRQINSSIQEIVSNLREIGHGHFKNAVRIQSKDEFGKVAQACNNVIASMGEILKTLKIQTETLSQASERLSHVGKEISTESHEIGEFAKQVAEATERVTENLKVISQSIEQLNIATQEIAQNVGHTASISEEARRKAHVATEVMQRLKENSERIGNIVQVITQIADQTNLLALNATIEAARAGEAGKGFAVVANEVKELARQTAKSTEEIANMVNAVQEDVENAVQAVRDVDEIISNIGDLATAMASATEEQTATTEDISRNVQAGIESVVEVNNQVQELARRIEHFSVMSLELGMTEEVISDIVHEISIVRQFFEIDEKAIEEARRVAEDSVKVLTMTLQHFQWREKLLNGILNQEAPQVETDPSRCALGRWLTSFKPIDARQAQILQELEPVHNDLHRSAVRALEYIRKGEEISKIYRVLKDEISPKVYRVVGYLTELRQTF